MARCSNCGRFLPESCPTCPDKSPFQCICGEQVILERASLDMHLELMKEREEKYERENRDTI